MCVKIERCLVVAVCSLLLLCVGVEAGKRAGYDHGYSVGHSDGSSDGWAECESEV